MPESSEVDRHAKQPETMILRFIQPGMASSKRSCGIGEVWPVEMAWASRLLKEEKPVVELATPEELKRDRDLVERICAMKQRWDRLEITDPQSRLFVVRYVKQGTHPKGHIREPGAVIEVDEDHAYSLCRGRSPECELATSEDLKAHRERLARERAANGLSQEGDSELLSEVGGSHADKCSPGTEVGKLSPCVRLAYNQYVSAKERDPEIITDEDAYRSVEGHLESGETLPKIETWIRYVGIARKFFGTQKNSPRGTRTGRSFVRENDL